MTNTPLSSPENNSTETQSTASLQQNDLNSPTPNPTQEDNIAYFCKNLENLLN